MYGAAPGHGYTEAMHGCAMAGRALRSGKTTEFFTSWTAVPSGSDAEEAIYTYTYTVEHGFKTCRGEMIKIPASLAVGRPLEHSGYSSTDHVNIYT